MGHLLRSGVEGSLLPPSLSQGTSSSVLLGDFKSRGLPPPRGHGYMTYLPERRDRLQAPKALG